MGCKHQCTCIDGAVGCGPLCTTSLPLSSPSCPYPRLVRVPGQCCVTVDCHKGAIPPLMPPWKTKEKANGPLHKSENMLGNELWERRNGWEDNQGYKHLTSKRLVYVQVYLWNWVKRQLHAKIYWRLFILCANAKGLI